MDLPPLVGHIEACLFLLIESSSCSSLYLSRLTIGCTVAITFVFGLFSVLLASILSGKTRKKYFWGYRKNLCARILNGFVSSRSVSRKGFPPRLLFHLVPISDISLDIVMARNRLLNVCSIVRSLLRLFRRL